MKTDKTFYLQNMKALVNQIQQIQRELKESSERQSMEWKDRRKDEFYRKHVHPRLDDIKSASSDMQMILQQLEVIDNSLKRYGN
jgi:hypothetical protein